jgi:hypothetical protein
MKYLFCEDGFKEETEEAGDIEATDGCRIRRGGKDDRRDRVEDDAVDPASEGVGGGVFSETKADKDSVFNFKSAGVC